MTEIHELDATKNTVFIGRKEELRWLASEIDKEKSITVIVGEEGIGKSTLIQEFCKRLKNTNNPHFVGVYDNNSISENSSQSLILPFIIVLEALINEIQNMARVEEKLNITKNRLKNALEKFAKQKGKEIASAIITDVAKKIGLEETLKIAKEFLTTYEGEKSIVTITQDFISKHKEETLSSYLAILSSLSEQFHDREFVLIFDQFESARKTSIDFFINFVKRMPQQKFHIMVSFKTYDISDDNSSKKLYEYALRNLKELGADILEVPGLVEEEIREWIKLSRKQNLFDPDLRRIKEESSGFPLLLNQWINMPISDIEWIAKAKESGFGNVNRGQMCELVDQQKESFSNDPSDKVNLNKIAVLAMPLTIKELARYLDYDFDFLYIFLERLVRSGLFVKKEKYLWYKHNLIQQCLENGLFDEYRQAYLKKVATFYLDSIQEVDTSSSEAYNDIAIGCAYYLHKAGFNDKSLDHNVRIARMAFNYGDLDLAEKCYQRAIIDAQILGKVDKKMKCILELSRNVYMIWEGRYHEAKNNYDSILEYSINVKDDYLHVQVLSELANYYDVTDNCYDKSLSILYECLSLLNSKQPKNESVLAAITYQIAGILKKQGKYELALDEYSNSLSLFKNSILQSRNENSDGQHYAIAADVPLYLYQSLYNIADIYRIKKEYDAALKLYNQSLLKAKDLKNQLAIAETLMGIARLYYECGDYDEALKKYEERLVIEEKVGHQFGAAVTMGYIGRTYLKKAMNEKARQYLENACVMLKELNRTVDAEKFEIDLSSIQNR